MLPYYTTHIDTLAIQINCSRDNNKQREILLGIKEHFRVTHNPYIDPVKYKAGFDTRIEHKVYCNNRTVLSIQTGFSNNNYYIKITFAGLQTYDYLVDNTSYQFLWSVAAYINSNHLGLNITELDIAIDVPNVSFNNLMAFCSSHTSRTVYHGLGEIQIYDDETSYIEKFKNKVAASIAIKRAYLYTKTYKEFIMHNNNIGYDIQRFEVKLQSKYFHKYGLDISSIEHTLSKYHLLYFENLSDKNKIIDRYNSYAKVTKREIDRMDLEKYRLYPDMEYINLLLYHIQTITMDDLYPLEAI